MPAALFGFPEVTTKHRYFPSNGGLYKQTLPFATEQILFCNKKCKAAEKGILIGFRKSSEIMVFSFRKVLRKQ
ncbi:MAG: hypothetical protein LPK19_11725 [Hymenobacteraceae bacterium]|nr:hypothetical protein [Hymenobacteraceae bacterium]MDX5396895.1 hypothetical protein [Hymenobacteraceae bacterium]MDX5512969.1 hypothetical protein [Hymenobacteraceae bacterium]